MDRRLNGLYPLAYAGVNPVTPAPFLVQKRDPTTTDSQNVVLGTFWLNNNVHDPHYEYVWVLVALTQNVATWVLFTTGTGSLIGLRADDGNTALPLAGIINIHNTDGNILTTAATANTVTFNFAPSIVVQRNITAVNGVLFVGNDGTTSEPVAVIDANQTSTNGFGAVIQTTKQHGAGNPVTSGDTLGTFGSYGYDGTNFVQSTAIISTSSGTIAANRVAGTLTFATHPDSTSGGLSATARMTIQPTGQVLINTPTTGAINAFQVAGGIIQTVGSPGGLIRSIDPTATTFGGQIEMIKSRAGGVITTGDNLGQLIFGGINNIGIEVTGAAITSTSTGAIGATIGANLNFLTQPVGANPLAQRMSISSAGNVVVSAPDSGVALTVSGSNVNDVIDVYQSVNDGTAPTIGLLKSRLGGVITSGDYTGEIVAGGYDGGGYTENAAILFKSSGTIGAGRVAGDIEFWTHPDSVNPITVRMSVTSTGTVQIGTPDSGVALTVGGSGAFGGDNGGTATYTTITNATVAASTGTNTIKSSTGGGGQNSAGYLKFYVGTTAVYVPYFTTT